MSKGFARNGWPRGNEIIIPANFVAHATPHTKGSWVEIDASAARDVVGMRINVGLAIGSTAIDTSMLLDIGIGAAAAEVAVVSNVPVGAYAAQLQFYLPIHIPAGSRIAGRIQGAVTVDIFTANVTLLFGSRPGSWGGYSIAETIGVDTATSGPTTGDLADNAWDEAIASTANAYRALTIHPCYVAGSTVIAGGTSVLLDFGVGGAGSERVIGSARALLNTNESLTQLITPVFVEAAVSAGSRLAIRKNGTDDISAALIGWR